MKKIIEGIKGFVIGAASVVKNVVKKVWASVKSSNWDLLVLEVIA